MEKTKGKWKQTQHVRKIPTKKGKKPVIINKGTQKKRTETLPAKKRKKEQKYLNLTSEDKKIFDYIKKHPEFKKEYGGGISVDKDNKIKFVSLISGDFDEISLPADYQVLYHTHPNKKSLPPSPVDVVEFLRNPYQNSELIFAKDDTYVLVKSKDTPKRVRNLEKKLVKKYDELSRKRGDWEKDWLDFLEKETKIKIKKDNSKSLKVPLLPLEQSELLLKN